MAFAGADGFGQAASPAATGQGYTLRTNVRAVVTDVLVLNHAGQPVHGLLASAFHLFDDKQPQKIASFEEHAGVAEEIVPAEATSPGVYNNGILLHPPPVLNVAVLDVVNLDLADQMFLSDQMTRFVKVLPEGVPLAIYLHAGGRSVLLQDFTANRGRLLASFEKVLPLFPSFTSGSTGDGPTLDQIAKDLIQLPGRKNVLWFSGGTELSATANGILLAAGAPTREIFDELETGRIAIYPIDARGLMALNLTASGGDQRVTGPFLPAPGLSILSAQHGAMQDVALATGGLPFYNTNGLWQAARRAIDSGEDFYTLTYSPGNIPFDGKWHRLRVAVDGKDLQLSYRQGYFADSSHIETPQGPRTRLLAGGRKTVEYPTRPGAPIVFQAEARPAVAGDPVTKGQPALQYGKTRYSVDLALPPSAFSRHTVQNESQLTVGVTMLALNHQGAALAATSRQLSFAVNEENLKLKPKLPLLITQQIDLGKGEAYLYVAVWDPTTHRYGTVNVPVEVGKKSKK